MTTETLDKLYLEWSQFTKARTRREITMLKTLEAIRDDPAVPPWIQTLATGAVVAVSTPGEPNG